MELTERYDLDSEGYLSRIGFDPGCQFEVDENTPFTGGGDEYLCYRATEFDEDGKPTAWERLSDDELIDRYGPLNLVSFL